jgi:DNA-binding GntR family transcriptional regulator
MTESPFSLPQRQILTDSVYEAVKELLMDLHIEPGSRVRIDRLARQLNVSQTPVREALARLEADGLVTKEPLRGYSTAPLLDAASFDQLFELRLLLEPFAARRAAAGRTDAHLRALEEANVGMRAATAKTSTGTTYREYRLFAAQDARFHEAVAAASGNELLRDTLVRLRAHLHLYRLYFHSGVAAETLPEHERLLAAIRGGEAKLAERAMREHVERSRRRLRAASLALDAED